MDKKIARYTALALEHMDKTAKNEFKSPEEFKASLDNVMAHKEQLMVEIERRNQ